MSANGIPDDLVVAGPGMSGKRCLLISYKKDGVRALDWVIPAEGQQGCGWHGGCSTPAAIPSLIVKKE